MQEYAPKSFQQWYRVYGIALFVVSVIPALVFVFNPDLWPAAAAALLMDGLGALCIIMAKKPGVGNSVQETYAVEANGLRVRGPKGAKMIAWSDVAEVYFREAAVMQSTQTCRLVTKAGETLLIDQRTSGHYELGKRVADAVTAHMQPAANQALRDGREVAFGDLVVSRSHVAYKDKRIAWRDVGFAGVVYNGRLRGDYFEVMRPGHDTIFFRVSMVDTPNEQVFRNLLSNVLMMQGLANVNR